MSLMKSENYEHGGKIFSADDTSKYFLIFLQKIDFELSCKWLPGDKKDKLQEMSKPTFYTLRKRKHAFSNI